MATIVLFKITGKHHVLVGTGYSFFKDSRPSFFGGTLFPYEDEGEVMCAAICNEHGAISWVPTNELEVITVDGIEIREVLKPYINLSPPENTESEPPREECPGCGVMVSLQDSECPSCGLKLVD